MTQKANGATANDAWGYPFGIDGLMSQSQVRVFLGCMSKQTLIRRIAAGLIRKGKDGPKRVVICRRSVVNYASRLEE